MIFLNLDLGGLDTMRQTFEPTIQQALAEAARDLTHMTHARILESAQNGLHSTRDAYVKGLTFKQIEPNIWLISLDKSAMWIEEGITPGKDMLESLLASPKAKMGKHGKYIAVPFEHKKGPTAQTAAQTNLTDTIKAEMRRRNIPYGKIENDELGKPRLGLIHAFSVPISKHPVKTHEGPGQGRGAIGDPQQGPTGIPFLHGVKVYQKKIPGVKNVQKSIMTFRIASASQRGKGMWQHPGLEAKHYFEEAEKWALDQWENHIRDQVVESIIRKL